ncbi:MFS transporter [Amaricoccus solimangrovi]|uniref:MFS transporter n=1 Tax=Amaricoccus solimangrovi TaxID=2589815 RepID=A0A501WU60_9RHOB|nr:MFS transporter [Amaricoccus solimangrovi]TPE49366.1 MFS transporter [Amaricoccus solimangrovi]
MTDTASPSGTGARAADGGLALALLVAGTFFMENLDATVITPAIPAMAESFAARPVDLNTGVSAYMLTVGAFIPISGWAAERFGARPVLGFAITLFTLASLLCGLAGSLPVFVASRILQGIGGALMVPVGRLVVLRATPKERLIAAIATLTWPALVAPVLGPPLGGLLVEHGDWRWIFYLNLPLGLVALALTPMIVPAGGANRASRFDWPGFLSMGGALFCLMLVAEMLSRPGPDWARILAAAALGLGLLLWGTRHIGRAAHPVFDLSALRLPSFAVTIWGGSLFRMGVSAVPFLLPLLFQIGFGFDPLAAGLMLMAVFAGNLAMKPMTTPVIRRFGFRPVLVVNGLLNAGLIAAIAGFSAGMPLALACALLFLGGMTRSMQFTALNTIAFADVPDRDMTSANTLFSTVFQLAMGLGVALGAVAWRAGEALAGGGDPAMPFRIAFLLVALVALVGVIDSARLHAEAGARVARRGDAKSDGPGAESPAD